MNIFSNTDNCTSSALQCDFVPHVHFKIDSEIRYYLYLGCMLHSAANYRQRTRYHPPLQKNFNHIHGYFMHWVEDRYTKTQHISISQKKISLNDEVWVVGKATKVGSNASDDGIFSYNVEYIFVCYTSINIQARHLSM